ncbi:pentatricopeptide repeat-containing protein At5g01110-like [Solanum pennellii]|uniref:Pentatricopeptide repeat-containing protein At5g01110-like n=1 Tax=Solanum pennellii TaxID=28526 RepID=A0ABM1V4C0_SOLPN|nr:pentatricopeptide repeat-containing protein At5g01110-like [Solanum pennellii]
MAVPKSQFPMAAARHLDVHKSTVRGITTCASLVNTTHLENSPISEPQHFANGSSTPPSEDTLLVQKILWNLKQCKSITNSLHGLNPSTFLEVLGNCRDNLHLAQKFINFVSVNCPNFKHCSSSLTATVHVLIRFKRVADVQGFILRMIRRTGVSRIEIVESVVSTYGVFGSNPYAFDLLIRTCVQARKIREAVEVF